MSLDYLSNGPETHHVFSPLSDYLLRITPNQGWVCMNNACTDADPPRPPPQANQIWDRDLKLERSGGKLALSYKKELATLRE